MRRTLTVWIKSLEHATDNIGSPGGVNVLGRQDISRRVEVEPVGHVARKLLWALLILLLELLLTQKPYLVKEPPLRTTFWGEKLLLYVSLILSLMDDFPPCLCQITYCTVFNAGFVVPTSEQLNVLENRFDDLLHAPLALLRHLDGYHEEGEAPRQSLLAGDQVVRQALRPELGEQSLGSLVSDELRHVAAGAGGVVLVEVFHGEGEVGVVDVLDRHHVDHDAHLARPEGLARPDALRDVLVGDGEEVLLGDLLHPVEALVVHEAGAHQVGRVVVLPKVVQLVAQVPLRAVGRRGRGVHFQSVPAKQTPSLKHSIRLSVQIS